MQEIVKKYSNHIAFPIFLTYDKSEWNAEKKEFIKSRTTEQVNAASAMWQRPKSELEDDDYKEFYKSITGDWEDPLFWFHTRAEGTLEYTTLFYIPAKAPLDLYQADYKGGVKLYVKRVFIMDDSKDLLPQYLRFVRGIIDSEDLPLNVSREILQQNKVLTSIKTASVKKILSELKTIATDDPEKYSQFIAEYNRPLKEGLYGDYANRETLLDLIRFKSTKVEGLTSLAEAKERMQPEQKSLYYITGGSESCFATRPCLRSTRRRHRGPHPRRRHRRDRLLRPSPSTARPISRPSTNPPPRRPEGRSHTREGRRSSSLCSKRSRPPLATPSKRCAPHRGSPTVPPSSSPTKTSPRPACVR